MTTFCRPDDPCMEPECEDCSGLRFFAGVINGLLIFAIFWLLVAFVGYAIYLWMDKV